MSTETEVRIERCERHMQDAADQMMMLGHEMKALAAEVRFVRRRLNQILPEQRHCPKCKKLVNPRATSCSCGEKWGEQPDPKAGLPG